MADSKKTILSTSRFTVVEHRVERSDGSRATCVAVEHPGAVVILPILTDGRICLIRNHRLTVGSTLVELPAGTLGWDEPPLEAAHRELQEETGFTAGEMEAVTSFYPSPGLTNERMHVFRATGLVAGPPQREANEEIDNLIVEWPEALAMLERAEIQDGKTIVTLLYEERKRQQTAEKSSP